MHKIKANRNKVVLHFFGHLSESKSSIEFAEDILEAVKEKLTAKDLETSVTPFGYSLEFKIHVKGDHWQKCGNQYNFIFFCISVIYSIYVQRPLNMILQDIEILLRSY